MRKFEVHFQSTDASSWELAFWCEADSVGDFLRKSLRNLLSLATACSRWTIVEV